MAAEDDRGGYPGHSDWDWTDRLWLDSGKIPPRFCHYKDGVCIWPNAEGTIPEGWDGTYPAQQMIVVRTSRSGRSRRR
jgi:hypothetical protein